MTAMADGDDTEHSCSKVDLVDDPVAPDAISPISLELSNERDALVRVHAGSTERGATQHFTSGASFLMTSAT
jgi:hypothetical protein